MIRLEREREGAQRRGAVGTPGGAAAPRSAALTQERRGRLEFASTSPGSSSTRSERRASGHACTTALVFSGTRGCALAAVHACAPPEDV